MAHGGALRPRGYPLQHTRVARGVRLAQPCTGRHTPWPISPSGWGSRSPTDLSQVTVAGHRAVQRCLQKYLCMAWSDAGQRLEAMPTAGTGCNFVISDCPAVSTPATIAGRCRYQSLIASGMIYVHISNNQHHTDNKQGNPDDALHSSLLLRSASIHRKEACRFLRIIAAPDASFLLARVVLHLKRRALFRPTRPS